MHSTLYFGVDEYQHRIARAREAMANEGIDLLLVSDANNLTYLSGYRTNLFHSKFRPFFALIPREGSPILVLPSLEKGVGEEYSWIPDIRTWGTRPGDLSTDPLAALASVLTSEGFGDATIAIELSNQRIGMSNRDFERVKSSLPEATWADLCPIVWGLRAIKSAAEIANLRRSAEISDAAWHAVLDMATVGTSEKEIASTLGETFIAEGGELGGFIVVNSGPQRYKLANPYASDYRLQTGDMCIIDFGAVYDGYWCDLTRAFFAGAVADYQRELYEFSVSATEQTVAMMKPGLACEEIDAFAESLVIEAGYQNLLLHRTGHSIGLEMHELPSLGLGESTTLKPGMVLAVEPALYDFNVGAFRMEDIVVVTEVGVDYLSQGNRELNIL